MSDINSWDEMQRLLKEGTRLHAEIQRLKEENAHLTNYEHMLDDRAEKMNDAAAFLDVLAHHITRWPAVGNHLKEQQQAAADCRKMAARLRG